MAEKTEAPTPRRLQEARDRGQVARSHELNTAFALLIGVWLLLGPGQSLWQNLGAVLREAFAGIAVMDITDVWLRQRVYSGIVTLSGPLIQIFSGLLVIGVTVTLAQTGLLWASKRPFFDFNRVNPINGFKRLFSISGLVEMVKALFKLLVIGWIAFDYLRGNIERILLLAGSELTLGLMQWIDLAKGLLLRVAVAYLVLAVADYIYQRWQHLRSLRMTKQEVLEDFKRSEGDPFLRGRIRQQQRRMARMRMMSNVPKADVVVTNPTRLAVAVGYEAGEMNAPKVLAKGAYLLAGRIVAIAKDHDIPVVQNIPLARAMYKNIEVDQEIPSEMYVAMAEVLAYVYRIRGKKVA